MRRTTTAVARVALLVALIAGAGVVLTAGPAAAHGLGGIEPTNYESRLLKITPDVNGIELKVIDLGTELELTNRTASDVTVLGYDDEPYLRIGPRGVFENTRSPATYINRSTTLTTTPPKSADPDATPRWKQVSSGQSASWHDHRAHFMGTDDPPFVERDPGKPRVFDHWTVTMLRANGSEIVAAGEIAYVPPPSPWPYVAAAAVLAVALFLASRTRLWKWVMGGALVVIIGADALHVVGLWNASTESAGTKVLESAYSIGGIALGILALVWMARRGADAAMPLILVAAIVLVIAGGLADITTLGHSQILTTLPESLARVLVTLTLGLGVGLTAAAGARLHASSPKRTRRPHPRERQNEREPASATS